ncbi:MAG: hypothetical protein J5846_01810 [Desulfovibrio sp.]|nr:hypothetical protein [Desulfovibrio sp.]
MKTFFLGRMAIVDLSRGKTEYQTLPAEAAAKNDLSLLCRDFDDALIFASGQLSASLAPAACVVTAYAKGQTCLLTAHLASALKRTGLDALVLQGTAETCAGLLLNGEETALLPLDPNADSASQGKALRVSTHNSFPDDSDPVCLVTGMAAFQGAKAPALVQDVGIAPRSAMVAEWLACHNLCGIALAGTKPYPSPLPFDHPIRTIAEPLALTRESLSELLACARAGSAKTSITIGRAIACHACPAPCGFFLPEKSGFVACTCPEALAALLAKGASQARVAEILRLSWRFGLDPLGLLALADAPALPETLPQILSVACAEEEQTQDDLEELGSLLGVCPFYLRRFPEVAKALANFCA